jgi:aldose 1-epimerase
MTSSGSPKVLPRMTSLSPENNFSFLPQGAIIQEFKVQGHNIVQSFPRAELYHDAPYFGETIGRTSNRIKSATIESLNGKSYKLAQNDGPNSLHGGKFGFGKRLFNGPVPIERNGREAVRFTYLSADGEEGYPGTVELRVWYTAWEEKEGGMTKVCLEAEYEVEMVGDECEETVVGITNHRYDDLLPSVAVGATKYLV